MTLKKIDIGEITKAVKNCTTPIQKETINISSTWENVLPQMVRIYSSLNSDGKKEVLRRMAVIGKIVDKTKQLKKRKVENETK